MQMPSQHQQIHHNTNKTNLEHPKLTQHKTNQPTHHKSFLKHSLWATGSHRMFDLLLFCFLWLSKCIHLKRIRRGNIRIFGDERLLFIALLWAHSWTKFRHFQIAIFNFRFLWYDVLNKLKFCKNFLFDSMFEPHTTSSNKFILMAAAGCFSKSCFFRNEPLRESSLSFHCAKKKWMKVKW